MLIIFILNFIAHWAFYFKGEEHKHKSSKPFSIIMIITIGLIPIINSSFFQPFFKENISYFGQYWTWFLIIGIIFMGIGLKIHSLAFKALNVKKIDVKQLELIRKDIFAIIRHPIYLSWILMFFGLAFILDSFIALIFCPILIIFIEFLGFFEEKYILIPEFRKKYKDYKKKTPNRLIAPPYNYILIFIAIIAAYIGFLNFSNIV